MEYTNRRQSDELKQAGVDVMSSDLFIYQDEKTYFGQLNKFICPRCHGELIWMSDFTRKEVEGYDENIDGSDYDDALVSYYQCRDCNCNVEVVDAWPDEEGDGPLFRIAWSGDALMKLITDAGANLMLTKVGNNDDGDWIVDVFADSQYGGIFKKRSKTKIGALVKSVVEMYENKSKTVN